MKLAVAGYLFPFFFLFKPGLALLGSPLHITFSILEGTSATILIAMAIEGYFIRPMNILERVALLVGGLSLFAPGWETDILAIRVVTPVLYFHWRRSRKPSGTAWMRGESN